jgi:hypothetical protein
MSANSTQAPILPKKSGRPEPTTFQCLKDVYRVFISDPPNNDYERGYLAAILDLGRGLNLQCTSEWRQAYSLIRRVGKRAQRSPPRLSRPRKSAP